MTLGELEAKSLIYGSRGLWIIATSQGTFGVFDYTRRWLGEVTNAEAMTGMLEHQRDAAPSPAPAPQPIIASADIDF